MEYSEYGSLIYGLIFWAFVPPLATQLLLTLYYRVSGRRRPPSGSKDYELVYFRAFVIVTVGYFTYNVVQYGYEFQGTSLYDVMGLARWQVDSRLSSVFKQQAISLHPDKNPNQASDQKNIFLKLKQTYEILSNENLRAAYDVYGMEVFKQVQESSTSSKTLVNKSLSEYFWQAFYEFIAFVGITTILATLSALFGSARPGTFWRFLGIATVASIELYILMRPKTFGILKDGDGSEDGGSIFLRWWWHWPIFFRLGLLRRIFIYGTLAIDQILGQQKKSKKTRDQDLIDQVTALNLLIQSGLTKECDYHLTSQLDPARKSPEMKNLLQRKMGQLTADLHLLESLTPDERQQLLNKLREENKADD